MMQKSMITYMTLAAPLLPGADAVQCCFGRRGVTTSPETQVDIPAKLAIWTKNPNAIPLSGNMPDRFTVSVTGWTGWPFPKYTTKIQRADGEDAEKKLSAKQMKALFSECQDFEGEFRSRYVCGFPGETAKKRVEFLQGWLNGKVFYNAEDTNCMDSVHEFSAIHEGKFVVGSTWGSKSTYEITFESDEFEQTKDINADQICDLFGKCDGFMKNFPAYKNGHPADSANKRSAYLQRWLQDQVFCIVAPNEAAAEFDVVDVLLNKKTTSSAGHLDCIVDKVAPASQTIVNCQEHVPEQKCPAAAEPAVKLEEEDDEESWHDSLTKNERVYYVAQQAILPSKSAAREAVEKMQIKMALQEIENVERQMKANRCSKSEMEQTLGDLKAGFEQRGIMLGKLEEKTNRMEEASADFLSMAKKLREDSEKRSRWGW